MPAARLDPYRDFRFSVSWDGADVPGVARVGALLCESEIVWQRDAASPPVERPLPGRTRYAPVALERGITSDRAFEKWADVCLAGLHSSGGNPPQIHKEVAILLLDEEGRPVFAYRLHRAWVSSYQALPQLDANGAAVAIERIVLQHEGWDRDLGVVPPP